MHANNDRSQVNEPFADHNENLEKKPVSSWNSDKNTRKNYEFFLKSKDFDSSDKIKIHTTKNFWKTIRQYFSDKDISSCRLSLKDKNELLEKNHKTAKTWQVSFKNITNKTLKLKQNNLSNSDISTFLSYFKNHNSIKTMKNYFDESNKKIHCSLFHLRTLWKWKKLLTRVYSILYLKAESNT